MVMPDQTLNSIHKEGLKRFEQAELFDRKDRMLAVEDTEFCLTEEGQWSGDDVKRRGDRPRLTFNRTIEIYNQIVGTHKQNRSTGKVSPESGDSSDDTAKIFSGIIKKIESSSSAQESYDNAFDEVVAGGYGGWRYRTEFKDDSFDQEIVIEPILSASTSYYLFDSRRYNGSDAPAQFIVTYMNIDQFKEEFPDAGVTDFAQEQYRTGICSNWFDDEQIRIAEYWRKVPVTKEIALMSNGQIIDLKEEHSVIDELAIQGITVIKSRKMKSHSIEMYKMNGAEILEGPIEWAGKYIPIVPSYGGQIWIRNKRRTRSAIRFAKDANRAYNFSRSTEIEAFALTPKDPLWMSEVQGANHKAQNKTFPVKNPPIMFYTPDPLSPGPPQRGGAPAVQMAGISISQQSIQDIYSTSGVHPASLGDAPQLLSEKTARAQAEKGDISVYTFQDNHEKSLKFGYEILIDLIPRIMDTPQMIQIMGVGESTESVEINTPKFDELNQTVIDTETGEPVIVNNLSAGKYKVVVETGPTFSTQRQESVDQLIRLAEASPVFQELTPDLIAKNLNLVDGDEFVSRVRRFMIDRNIAEPTEDEIKKMGLDQPPPPDPEQEALRTNVEMQTAEMQANILKKDAETQQVIIETQSKAIDALKTLMEAMEAKAKAGLQATPQEQENIAIQSEIVAESQEGVQRNQEKESFADEASQEGVDN